MFLPKIALNAIPFTGLYDEKFAALAVRKRRHLPTEWKPQPAVLHKTRSEQTRFACRPAKAAKGATGVGVVSSPVGTHSSASVSKMRGGIPGSRATYPSEAAHSLCARQLPRMPKQRLLDSPCEHSKSFKGRAAMTFKVGFGLLVAMAVILSSLAAHAAP